MPNALRFVSLGIAVFMVAALVFVSVRGGSDTVTAAGGSDTAEPSTPTGQNDAAGTTGEEPEDETSDEPSASDDAVLEFLINDGPAPEELVEIEAWLQTDASSLEEVRGEVTIVKFWTFSCINCKRTVPHFQDIYAKYQDQGLEIVGVHAPEFDFERDLARIQEAANDQGIVWPIAVDNTKKNFRSWQGSRRFWPRYFVIDQNGDIRYDKIGEGKYDRLEAVVAYLLENPPEPTDGEAAAE